MFIQVMLPSLSHVLVYSVTSLSFAHVSTGTEVYRWNAQIRQVTHSADLTDFLPQNPPKAFQNHISNNKISSIIALTFDSYFDDLE